MRCVRKATEGPGRRVCGCSGPRNMQILEDAAEATHTIPARTCAHFGKQREQIRNRGSTGRGRANPAAHQGRGHTAQ
eukprot:934541-Heterocapsa_arctica.AAC.1